MTKFLLPFAINIIDKAVDKIPEDLEDKGAWLSVRGRKRTWKVGELFAFHDNCLLYTSPSPRDRQKSRMPSSA